MKEDGCTEPKDVCFLPGQRLDHLMTCMLKKHAYMSDEQKKPCKEVIQHFKLSVNVSGILYS